MRTLRDEHEADAELGMLRFMQASLKQAHPDREYSLAACARMRDNAAGRVKTRDSGDHLHIYLDSKPPTDGAKEMNRLLARAGDTKPTRTRDASTARQLYTRNDDGSFSPVMREGAELPDFVRQDTSRRASQRQQNPWAAGDLNESRADQVTRNKALNEANRQYYENDGQGHAPGEVSSYNEGIYGESGEGDHDYGAYHVSRSGHDETPRRNSPPPPDEMDGSYLSPLAAERQFQSPVSAHEDTFDPHTGWGVKPNQGRENRRVTSQGQVNYGTSTPNLGNPDRWTRQAGSTPTMFNPNSAGGGGSANDQTHLRYLNNYNRRRAGDRPITGPLPALQRDDAGSEVIDWVGHRSFGGRSV